MFIFHTQILHFNNLNTSVLVIIYCLEPHPVLQCCYQDHTKFGKSDFYNGFKTRPHPDLLLKSIKDGPYQMKFIADTEGNITLQTRDVMSEFELDQYNADYEAAWFITTALPNAVYTKLECDASAQELWNHLAIMFSDEHLTDITDRLIRSCLQRKFPKTILPAPIVIHGFTYTNKGFLLDSSNGHASEDPHTHQTIMQQFEQL